MRSQFGRGRQLWMSIVMLLIAVWIGPQAHAGCGKRVAVAKVATKIKANHSTTAFVLTPIAFPVIVVAQPAVLYGYDRRAVADDSRYGSARRSNGPVSGDTKPDVQASSSSSIITRSCVACHDGTGLRANRGKGLLHPLTSNNCASSSRRS